MAISGQIIWRFTVVVDVADRTLHPVRPADARVAPTVKECWVAASAPLQGLRLWASWIKSLHERRQRLVCDGVDVGHCHRLLERVDLVAVGPDPVQPVRSVKVLSGREEERVDLLDTFPAFDLTQQYRSALVLDDLPFGCCSDLFPVTPPLIPQVLTGGCPEVGQPSGDGSLVVIGTRHGPRVPGTARPGLPPVAGVGGR